MDIADKLYQYTGGVFDGAVFNSTEIMCLDARNEILSLRQQLAKPVVVIKAKPLTWIKDDDSWYDKEGCGFHIYIDRDENSDRQYVAAWGEGDSEHFGGIDEACDWCQETINAWVNSIAIAAYEALEGK